jgi:serine/threonine protein kinase
MTVSVAELHVAADRVQAAANPEAVFGVLTGPVDEQLRELTTIYRRLAIVLHPDLYVDPASIEQAHAAFVKLTGLRTEAEAKLRVGSYGNPAVAAPVASAPNLDGLSVKTPREEYRVECLLHAGGCANLYRCGTSHATTVVLKVLHSARDNDLAENEYATLRQLWDKPEVTHHLNYLCRTEDSFLLRGKSGSQRRVNVLGLADGYYSLAQVMAAYPDGLDYRDVAWMLKRMLDALCYVHERDIVHGSLNPSHVLVHPITHGAKLVDWSASVRDLGPTPPTTPIRIMSRSYADYCAPEIHQKLPASLATDVFGVGACAVALLAGNPATGAMSECVPAPVRSFLRACLLPSPHRRPFDCWELHEEFDAILRRLVGKPQYRPLVMPGSTTEA